MATNAPVVGDRSMSVDRVFARAFAAIKTNPVVILGLALIVGAVPTLFVTYVFVQAGFSAAPEALAGGSITPGMFAGAMFLSALVSMVVGAIVMGALTRATVSASEGRQASFGESLSAGLAVALPLVGLGILSGLAIGFGLILLVVPGVILFVMWAVAAPALVIERRGVLDALGRSAELTSGARWKIFGIFIVFLIAYGVLSAVAGVVGLAEYDFTTPTTDLSTMNILGSIILGTLYNAASGTLWPALYVELRQWKEGTSVEALEEVFA